LAHRRLPDVEVGIAFQMTGGDLGGFDIHLVTP
jgi:hypothetical protein